MPDSVDGYPDVTIAVLESEQLTEVKYSSGNARLCLRKAPGSDDISGDFNQYAESNAVDVDGRSVTLQATTARFSLPPGWTGTIPTPSAFTAKTAPG